jgi:hypothetical protein
MQVLRIGNAKDTLVTCKLGRSGIFNPIHAEYKTQANLAQAQANLGQAQANLAQVIFG